MSHCGTPVQWKSWRGYWLKAGQRSQARFAIGEGVTQLLNGLELIQKLDESTARDGMELEFHTLDVFTETPFAGNPLAVVLGADGLDGDRMQAIAREMNFSETTFGIRSFGTYLNAEGHRGFTVNGEEVLIRGGGWVDDLLLSDTPEKIDAQLAYVKQMHLNTIRLEGFWGTSHYLYDAADREGILIMPGWSCQWEWEDYLGKPVHELYGGVLEPDEMDLVAASLGDQIRYLRNHPSIFTWVLASDLLPHPDLERQYGAAVDIIQEARVTNIEVEGEPCGEEIAVAADDGDADAGIFDH